jgi:hypothetical protein
MIDGMITRSKCLAKQFVKHKYPTIKVDIPEDFKNYILEYKSNIPEMNEIIDTLIDPTFSKLFFFIN